MPSTNKDILSMHMVNEKIVYVFKFTFKEI